MPMKTNAHPSAISRISHHASARRGAAAAVGASMPGALGSAHATRVVPGLGAMLKCLLTDSLTYHHHGSVDRTTTALLVGPRD
ncbi:hypothetical protein B0H14DRAFT_3505016 [Mycena olivaceomarginata]|nr:hypothetical protein B0H14DRAFT_3505016 [Mycena olivaceomarginata]